MTDNILIMQEALMRQIQRLSDDSIMKADGKLEVARSNAISQDALTFLKSANLKMMIDKAADGNKEKRIELSKYVGITVDEK